MRLRKIIKFSQIKIGKIDESVLETLVVGLDTLEKDLKRSMKEVNLMMNFVLSLGISVEEDEEDLDRQDLADLTDFGFVKYQEPENDEENALQPKGFGTFSSFNPFAEDQDESLDFLQRPEKNFDDVPDETHAIYLYESKSKPEIDNEDLERILNLIKVDDEKQEFRRTLENICEGISKLNSTREPGLYSQTLRVRDFLVEVRYSKVSDPSKSKYSSLFN